MLTANRARKLLSYHPDSGLFTRRSAAGGRKAGSIAGAISKAGYWMLSIDNRRYYAHRVAVLFMTGMWPPEQVDHIDGIRSNNCWLNLRHATQPQNSANAKAHRDNISGLKGVYLHIASGLWHATIMTNGTKLSLGYFKNPKDAHAAYAAAAREHHGIFARTA